MEELDARLVVELENAIKRKVELYRNSGGDFIIRVIHLPNIGGRCELVVDELWLKAAEIRKIKQLSEEILFGG